MFERLLSLRNDVGLLAEGYDPAYQTAGRQLSAGFFTHRAAEHCVQHERRSSEK
jgi:hypothetical protein